MLGALTRVVLPAGLARAPHPCAQGEGPGLWDRLVDTCLLAGWVGRVGSVRNRVW